MTVPNRTHVIDRLRRVPVLRREIRQGGVARMPVWAEPDGGGEPFAAFWAILSTGRLTLEGSHRDSVSETGEHTL